MIAIGFVVVLIVLFVCFGEEKKMKKVETEKENTCLLYEECVRIWGTGIFLLHTRTYVIDDTQHINQTIINSFFLPIMMISLSLQYVVVHVVLF